jgi:N4-gp56 family major capsid protein
MITTGNVNASGSDIFQTYLKKTFLENFEPELRFWKFGKAPVSQKGYESVTWAKMNKSTASASSALLTEGTTPNATDLTIGTISVSANQYGQVAIITDILEDTTLLNVIGEAGIQLGNNAQRIIDSVIQANLLDNGTYVIYGGNATSRVTISATDTITASNLAQANAFLSTKAAPSFAGYYIAVMHPNVIYDLQMQSGSNTWIELHKYTDLMAKNAVSGEAGSLFGIRIVRSAFIQTITSTVTVYPTYIFGQGAYGVSSLQNLETTYIPTSKKDKSDPLGQRAYVGWKAAFNSIILQQEALIRLETASALAYAWS